MIWILLLLFPQDLVPEGAKVEKAATGYRFTEGPAADKDGNIWFTDIPNEHIIKFDVETGEATVAREKTGRANGLMFDKDGRLHACEGGNRKLTRRGGYGTEVVAEKWDGKKFNSPNDLVFDGKGGVYFTDPRYGKRDDMEMEVEAVYHVSAKGKVTRIIDDLKRPNGIMRDGKTLYVADNGEKKIVAYDIQDDGTVKNGRDFAFFDRKARGGPDGMTVDKSGRVYAAGQGHVWVWDRKGKEVAKIKVPESPSNCTFGGADRRTLYITARTSLYRIRLNAVGR